MSNELETLGEVVHHALWPGTPRSIYPRLTDADRERYRAVAAAVVEAFAGQQIRQAYRQIDLYLEDGERNRLIVAQAILDPTESNHIPAIGRHRPIPDGRGQGMRVCVDCGRTEPQDAEPCRPK